MSKYNEYTELFEKAIHARFRFEALQAALDNFPHREAPVEDDLSFRDLDEEEVVLQETQAQAAKREADFAALNNQIRHQKKIVNDLFINLGRLQVEINAEVADTNATELQTYRPFMLSPIVPKAHDSHGTSYQSGDSSQHRHEIEVLQGLQASVTETHEAFDNAVAAHTKALQTYTRQQRPVRTHTSTEPEARVSEEEVRELRDAARAAQLEYRRATEHLNEFHKGLAMRYFNLKTGSLMPQDPSATKNVLVSVTNELNDYRGIAKKRSENLDFTQAQSHAASMKEMRANYVFNSELSIRQRTDNAVRMIKELPTNKHTVDVQQKPFNAGFLTSVLAHPATKALSATLLVAAVLAVAFIAAGTYLDIAAVTQALHVTMQAVTNVVGNVSPEALMVGAAGFAGVGAMISGLSIFADKKIGQDYRHWKLAQPTAGVTTEVRIPFMPVEDHASSAVGGGEDREPRLSHV